MPLEILEAGLLTTIQDLGRVGYQRLGIPTAGAMDPFALMAANVLVGNDPGTAALEITMVGPRVRFSEAAVIAVAGGDLGLRIDGQEAEGWKASHGEAGFHRRLRRSPVWRTSVSGGRWRCRGRAVARFQVDLHDGCRWEGWTGERCGQVMRFPSGALSSPSWHYPTGRFRWSYALPTAIIRR